jgi:transcriptional regulator with XRE-family HTH domain
MAAILKILGRNIKTRRTALDLSQEQLATLSGLHRTYVGAVERGERNISLLNLAKLATALQTEAHRLLESDTLTG